MTAILGCHGVGNYRPHQNDRAAADALAGIWGRALTKGMQTRLAVDVRVAYYAPHLRSDVAHGDDDPDDLDPAAQQMVRAWIDLLDPPPEIAAGRATAPLRRALEWVAQHFGLDNTLTRIFTTVFFREVATYFDPCNTFPRIRSRNVFLDEFTTYRPRVVIAHSLGSVVAYEALWARPDLHVDLLLTLGSPLGMPDVIFPRLDPTTAGTGWGQRPPGVGSWINISDTGDLIAIPSDLTQKFRGIDHNQSGTRIHMFDFHKVVNYLNHPMTTQAIRPHLDLRFGPQHRPRTTGPPLPPPSP
jgi:hypothetical protein